MPYDGRLPSLPGQSFGSTCFPVMSHIEGVLNVSPFVTKPAQEYLLPPDSILLTDRSMDTGGVSCRVHCEGVVVITS
jgi:hypothetical protein